VFYSPNSLILQCCVEVCRT